VVVVLAALLLPTGGLLVAPSAAAGAPGPSAPPTAAATSGAGGGASVDMQNRKLEQEIRKLEIDNDRAASGWNSLLTLAPSLAALAAIATVAVSWSKQREDTKLQRIADREQQEAESNRQFDANFAGVVANLGSASESLQASAASTLAVFLGSRYTQFHEHVLRVVIANLKTDHAQSVRRLLIGVLGRALTGEGHGRTPAALTGLDLELAGAHLEGLDVATVQFPEEMVIEEADLSDATLDGATMWKAKLSRAVLTKVSARHANLGQARLDGAVLLEARLDGMSATSASLRRVDARNASFKGARLQSAHFDGADLRGARFEGANLTDTYFLTALLDKGALASIVRTDTWRRAHFDDSVVRQLTELAQSVSG
jgi:uncharacterized protein YjbI with pentapeptide repeats